MRKTDFSAANFQRNACEWSCIHAATRSRWHVNMQKCFPGQPRCNFNLIARYFGRAYTYTCKARRDEALLKRLRAYHADELARFTSPGLPRIMEDRGEGYSGALPREIILRTSIFSRWYISALGDDRIINFPCTLFFLEFFDI